MNIGSAILWQNPRPDLIVLPSSVRYSVSAKDIKCACRHPGMEMFLSSGDHGFYAKDGVYEMSSRDY